MNQSNQADRIAELETELAELKNRKGYGLVWEDKDEDVATRCKSELPVLRECKTLSIKSGDECINNLLIEGDNYHALAVLNYTHANKIDVIYIDPPYNTGHAKEWKYNDKFVDVNDKYRHSKWLSMMDKRLRLAKNLLSDDGFIFISIDDHEQTNLKMLCHEIFGRENFIANIVWRKKYGGGKGSSFFVDLHEYVLCYSKNKSRHSGFTITRTDKQKEIFKEKDEYFEERGEFYTRPLKSGLAERKTLVYPIICPDGNEIKTQWICARDTFETLKDEGRIVFKKLKSGKYNVYKKFYKNDKNGNVLPESIFYDLAYNQNGKEELKSIFDIKEGRDIPFENPKPTKLISYLINLSCKDRNSIILDFFAGSGTTGHAVSILNNQDGGRRQFILCTNNENNNGDDDPKNGIARAVCQPRLKAVIKGHGKLPGIPSNLKYYKTAFVPAAATDANKIKLTRMATEMLCIRENTFDEVINNKNYEIYKNGDRYTAIIWNSQAMGKFIKCADSHTGRFVIYVFSFGETDFTNEFDDMKNQVAVKPIPANILSVYKRLFSGK